MRELGFPNYCVAAVVAAALLLVLGGCGGEDPEPADDAGAEAVTVEHKFGTTEVPADPERVVAVGFNDQDFALALDVHPVGARQFQAGIDITGRPWAQDALDGEQPKLIGAEEIDFERVAALRPDLILGVYSGMTDRDYELLSGIAPTVAQTGDHPDYGLPWQEQARLTGRALGRDDAAGTVVEDVEAEFARVRKAHPEFAGKRLVMAAGPRDYYVYGPEDLRTRFFASLGFETPPEVERLVGEGFGERVSAERLDLLDQDVLVIYGEREAFEADAAFSRLRAVREGRVIYLDVDGDFANALGFSSPLSLPFALDIAAPRLAAAVDGKPATKVEDAP